MSRIITGLCVVAVCGGLFMMSYYVLDSVTQIGIQKILPYNAIWAFMIIVVVMVGVEHIRVELMNNSEITSG